VAAGKELSANRFPYQFEPVIGKLKIGRLRLYFFAHNSLCSSRTIVLSPAWRAFE
jgi:hypothetical protein